MIVGRGVGDTETDRYDVEKGRIGKSMAGRAQIVAGMKDQFVGTDDERGTGEQRAIDATVIVGGRLADKVANTIQANRPEFHSQAGGRAPGPAKSRSARPDVGGITA